MFVNCENFSLSILRMIGVLLVSRSGLVEEDAVGSVPFLWFSLVLFFVDVKFQALSGKITMW